MDARARHIKRKNRIIDKTPGTEKPIAMLNDVMVTYRDIRSDLLGQKKKVQLATANL